MRSGPKLFFFIVFFANNVLSKKKKQITKIKTKNRKKKKHRKKKTWLIKIHWLTTPTYTTKTSLRGVDIEKRKNNKQKFVGILIHCFCS